MAFDKRKALQNALTFTQQGKWDKAITEYLAILRADPKALVGGPALANPRSPILPALLDLCSQQKVPLHFVSWHIYSSDPKRIRATIDNAVLALAKSDLDIGRMYAELVEDGEIRERIWGMIAAEHDRSREGVLKTSGQQELLEDLPWLRQSIRVRNPNTDPLNLVQVEWLRRLRDAERREDAAGQAECRELLRLTIEGVAAGMRTTG